MFKETGQFGSEQPDSTPETDKDKTEKRLEAAQKASEREEGGKSRDDLKRALEQGEKDGKEGDTYEKVLEQISKKKPEKELEKVA